MVTREFVVSELRRLVAEQGLDPSLKEFERLTGVSEKQIARRWGNWMTLRRAAGLSGRRPQPQAYSDDELFAALSAASVVANEFPSGKLFDRVAPFCWCTLERRFGRREAIWRAYVAWLQAQPADARPPWLREYDLEGDPAAIPGVTNHKSRADRQDAIDFYNDQLLYLDASLLGPPPPGWKEAMARVAGRPRGATPCPAVTPPERGQDAAPPPAPVPPPVAEAWASEVRRVTPVDGEDRPATDTAADTAAVTAADTVADAPTGMAAVIADQPDAPGPGAAEASRPEPPPEQTPPEQPAAVKPKPKPKPVTPRDWSLYKRGLYSVLWLAGGIAPFA